MASNLSFSSEEETESEDGSDDDDDETDGEEEDNECGVCGILFQEGELWIRCDGCHKWFHIDCTDQAQRGKKHVKRLQSWKCNDCL